MGVGVVKVTGQAIVPAQVAPSFDQVTSAENERKRQEEQARQRATEILNQAAGAKYAELLERIRRYGAAQLADSDAERLTQMLTDIDAGLDQAQGQVAARLRQAQARANSEREQVDREYREFQEQLAQYRLYPTQTLVKLWSEMRDTVLNSKENEVFLVPEADVIEILLNRDPNKALEAERQRLQKQLQESQ